MRRLLAQALIALLLAPAASAQNVAATFEPLQGRWVVTGAEHQGKPMDALEGGVMLITGENFEIRTAGGTLLRGALTLDTTKQPFQMDLVHADGARWEAIYAVALTTLRLNYVDAELKEPRPATFATSANSDALMISLRRESR